jgi:hypothetical protein
MDTERWQAGDEFPILDLVARFRFKSASSLSFDLGTLGDSLQLPDMDEPWLVGPGRVFTVIGWLDVHHPCDGFHRLRLRAGLPDRYVSWESMRDMVTQVFAVLELPADESYEVHLAGLSRQMVTKWPQMEFVS